MAAFVALVAFGKPVVDASEVFAALLAGVGTTLTAWYAASSAGAASDSAEKANRALAYAVQPKIDAGVRDNVTEETMGVPVQDQHGWLKNVGSHTARDIEVVWFLKGGTAHSGAIDRLDPGYEFSVPLGVKAGIGHGASLVERIEVGLTDELRIKRWKWIGLNSGFGFKDGTRYPLFDRIDWTTVEAP
jgi:hypothetical protein